MKKAKKIIVRRSSENSGGFGFTLRHFVIYPPSVSVNDILRASYSVVIDEHQQQKQIDAAGGGGGTVATPSSNSLIYHQGEQQQGSSTRKPVVNDNIPDDGTTVTNNPNQNHQSIDTIFVKEVRPDGPAYAAGLRQGDQILTVNHQGINGKTYSQVIAMIQNSPTDLILDVLPRDDNDHRIFTSSDNVYQNINSAKPIQYPRSSSFYPSTTMIEQKLRNLQINIAQDRTPSELAQSGIYFPPTSPSTPQQQQNIFSNYIESVHRALDSSKQTTTTTTTTSTTNKNNNNDLYYSSPYPNDYIQYDYPRQPSFQINFTQQQSNYPIRPPVPPRQNIPVRAPPIINLPPTRFNWNPDPIYPNSPPRNSITNESSEELKSPSTDDSFSKELLDNEKNAMTDADMKTEFVNFRKKQFETGRVVRAPESESTTKHYSEKKKYENEWNRLTAVTDLESVMERASHFEDVDPDKYARLKSKLPNSPPSDEKFNSQDNFVYQFNPNHQFYDSQTQMKVLKQPARQSLPDTSTTTFPFPRVNELNTIQFNIDQRFILPQIRTSTDFNPNSTYSMENYSNGIRQQSYRNALRTNNSNDQTDFVSQFGNPIPSQENIKQRPTSFPMNTNQQIYSNQNSYQIADEPQQQKIRSLSHHQSQAIKKLKSFFNDNVSSPPNEIEPLSPPSSSGGRSKSGSIFDGPMNNAESISMTTMTDNIEASKEGILYCKMVLKEGRRAGDRSWRGAWAVLRQGALFLGKEKKHGLLIPLSCDSFPINLYNADVELANDYIKKPRVFKLITSNQSEFLFQAPDIQSLNEWIELLREHSISSLSEQDKQRKSTTSLPPIAPQQLTSTNSEGRKSKSKISLRSPSLKRSPSLRFRKSKKSSITQPTQAMLPTGPTSPQSIASPRRSFVKSIVKKGIQTIISPTRTFSNPMSGRIYDESSSETLPSNLNSQNIQQGINFAIELEECETSSISKYIPIVVEILTKLIELRGINYQGIYRHAGGVTAVNWLVQQLDKGAENIDFNSEKWYDVKAVASTLKTFFAKLPDSLLSSKLSSLAVESSRIETHCDRLVELKGLILQLDDYRFQTLKYLCAHFRRVTAKCHINKIDARNLAIIIGPTLIWDSKASLQSNLVDNPEKIRIIESFILYYEWFFNENSFDSIPGEINPQMPRLPPVQSHGTPETFFNNETKPGEIIEHIVRAARRRWSSPILIDTLSSSPPSNDQQTSKSINISVKSVVRPN